MINIQNRGKAVILTEDEPNGRKVIELNEDVVLEPMTKIFFKTMLTISCDNELEECYVYSDPIFDMMGQEIPHSDDIGILTHKITKEKGNYEVVFVGGYLGDEQITLPKGTKIGFIYFDIKNPSNENPDRYQYESIYNADGINIGKGLNSDIVYDIQTEKDGTAYLRIKLNNY